ncbi:MAG: ral nucleoside transport system permease protein [Thermoleophilales bacterium]|jgi:simple sugar transport system permease protein|nr:ral nucleoside transport system permease protein [Thermoleophilales bacterium]
MDVQALLVTALWTMTPIAFAAIGEAVSERSGVLNIGLEGMMLTSAFVSIYVAVKSGNVELGLFAGIASGALVAGLNALLVLWTNMDQVVAGLTLNLLALGGTSVLARQAFTGTENATVPTFGTVDIPVLKDIPFLGPILFEQRLLTYVCVVIAIVLLWVLTRTTTGLRIQAAGEDPDAAALEGVAVRGVRLFSNLTAGLLAGVGGAFLALGIVGTFADNMVSGRGFIALAVVIIARWNPLLAIPAAAFFGFTEAIGIQLQTSGSSIPFQIFVALPYVATLVVLFTRIGSKAAPRQLGQAWRVDVR